MITYMLNLVNKNATNKVVIFIDQCVILYIEQLGENFFIKPVLPKILKLSPGNYSRGILYADAAIQRSYFTGF